MDPLGHNPPAKEPFYMSNPDAKRIDAHKEGANNELKTRNNSEKKPDFGKLGLIGDGRQK